VDTHWVGGDPTKLEVYGWASWNPRKATLTLRNPSDKPQEFEVDVQSLFELPKGAPQAYKLHSPWMEDRVQPWMHFQAGAPKSVTLRPFEVRVWNAFPE